MRIKKIIFILLITSVCSCKKFVEIGPPKDQITSSVVYSSDATATAVIRGIYSQMINGSGFASGGSSSITLLSGLSSDELINYQNDPSYIAFYTNSLTPANFLANLWSEPY